MNTQRITRLVLLFAGAIAFNFLFWQENLGVNILIYSTLLIVISVFLNPEARKSKNFQIAFAGVLLTGAMIAFHNSFAAKFVHFVSLFVFVGFTNQPKLRALFHALPMGVINLIYTPQNLVVYFSSIQSDRKVAKRSWRTIKLILFPLLFFWVFYLIFYFSNPVFASYSDQFWTTIGDWFADFFDVISLPWIVLLIAGFAVTGWIVFNSNLPFFVKFEERLKDTILRKKASERQGQRRRLSSMISLKNEYKSALFLVIPINALLLGINLIDINWLWFNFEYDGQTNLSNFVHEGTYLLIFSILLSMGILLCFFRKNLNFFPQNKLLVLFATIWIFQNLILVISVAIRNYHYIHYYGLAYKRIGVIFFLFATLVGLITLYIKIRNAKTSYYLLRVNSWNIYALLIVMSLINWDIVIAKHNVNHPLKKNIDVEFLLTLSDKTLPILHANWAQFETENRYSYQFAHGYTYELNRRIEKFIQRKESTTWKSWNYSERKALDYFTSKKR